MELRFSKDEEAFRAEVRAWLEEKLSGEFRELRGRGGPGDEHVSLEARRQWEKTVARAGYGCMSWPRAYRVAGRDLTLTEQVIFYEESVRARAPGRLGHIGEELLGPTLIHLGTEAQKRRFLPKIAACDELWCQGYSEPNAGSDLANVQTRATRDGDEWVITGQKIWTSHAQISDWCFVLCRTNPDAPKHRGISYLLVPMRQPGITILPIVQMTRGTEFCEVFFDGARTAGDNVVGEVDGGWKVAMSTLMFERGASTLAQQLGFENELNAVIDLAKKNGAARDPLIRDRIARAWMGLRVMRLHALRTLAGMQSGTLGREASISKLYWATWHRDLGELAMDVIGADAEILEGDDYALGPLQRLFLFSRADTIYAGTNEIQRNIIAERALGLPPEPRKV
jgi:alkylation response protein AidB-like acyl-CoA dehydrogenase